MIFLLGMMTGMATLGGLAWIAAFVLDDEDDRNAPTMKPDPHLYYDSL